MERGFAYLGLVNFIRFGHILFSQLLGVAKHEHVHNKIIGHVISLQLHIDLVTMIYLLARYEFPHERCACIIS